jgi:hypothetical protein
MPYRLLAVVLILALALALAGIRALAGEACAVV